MIYLQDLKKLRKQTNSKLFDMTEAETLNKIKSSKILITQIGSAIGRKYDQEQTLIGLGLNKLHRSSLLEDTPSVRGMVRKVNHLVKAEEIS